MIEGLASNYIINYLNRVGEPPNRQYQAAPNFPPHPSCQFTNIGIIDRQFFKKTRDAIHTDTFAIYDILMLIR